MVVEREGLMNHATFSPDGQRFITADASYTVRFYRINGKSYASHGEHDHEVVDAEFSADGHFVVSASRDGTAARSGCSSAPSWR